MAKNMYQKRRERKEAKDNEVEKVTTTNINCLVKISASTMNLAL